MEVAGREVQDRLTDALGGHVGPALQRNVEIRQDDLPRRSGVAPQRNNGESVIAAVTSMARESVLPGGLNRVTSPVPAGTPAIGQALRTA
jgi:hypothetical protein